MALISKTLSLVEPSPTISISTLANELKSKGHDIITLSAGEPDFDTPKNIQNAAIEAIQTGKTKYTAPDGMQILKSAIAKKFLVENKLQYDEQSISIGSGGKQIIYNALMATVDPGDEVLLPAPYWVSYSAIATLSEAKSIIIPSTIETDFKITPDQLEQVITPKTKLIMFNSPNNPSGTIYSEEEYRALGKVLEKYPDIFILSDEIYEHINYGAPHFSFASIKTLYDRTITVNGVAKAFAMTGWRIGYIGAPEWVAKACNKMQGQITSGANCIAQRATIAAISAPISSIKYMIDEFATRREIIINLLSGIPGFKLNKPQGAFYVFPDISYYFGREIGGNKIENASDFALFLLEEAHVATVTGEAFGNDNCIRISYRVLVPCLGLFP